MKTETGNYSYFTTVYVGSCSIRFQKRIASIFQKHNIIIKPGKKFLTTSATKVNARKYLMQMLFINTLALQIRASLTLEKHHNKSSEELQTTTEQIKQCNI